jgi:hypothetical protein
MASLVPKIYSAEATKKLRALEYALRVRAIGHKPRQPVVEIRKINSLC